MKVIKHMVTALAFFMLITPAFAASDISGAYKCTGYDPESKNSYDADLTVKKTGETYKFVWKMNDTSFSGTGFFSTTSADTIAAEWWNPKNQNSSGVMIYQVKPNVLDGHWVYADKETLGTETCKKASAADES